MSSKKYLRSVLSTFIALAIAVSGTAIALALSIKLGWTNERVLRSEMTGKGYVNESISLMREEIYDLVGNSVADTSGLDELLNEDMLYTSFYNGEDAALRGDEPSMKDVENFEKGLRAYLDSKLEEVYKTESVEANIESVVEEATRIYSNYMHPKFFSNFYDTKNSVSTKTIVVILVSIAIIVAGILILPTMYHYKRHAYPYAVGGLVVSVICNLFYIVMTLRSGWVANSGIEPECYRSLVASMNKYGGYVGLMVTGIEIIGICLMSYSIKKSKRAKY